MKKILLSLLLSSSFVFFASAQLELFQNGDMEEQGAWKVSQGNLLDPISYTFGSTANTVEGGVGANLDIQVKALGSANTNLTVYQKLDLIGGHEYTWSCAMRDLSTDPSCWWIKYVWLALEPTDDTDPAEEGIAQMHEWLTGKIYGFNGLFDTCTAAIVAESKTNVFVPEADGEYFIGINCGTCDSIGSYNWIVDEISFIDPTGVEGIDIMRSSNGNTLSSYPNPASNKINFTYSLSDFSDVELSIIDILGHEVATVTKDSQSQGKYTESFDCSNLANGMYYALLRVNNAVLTKKIIISK